ncbi:MAG: PorP/SprF family type IX secretion system membrane protein [Bacteroidales bacterium]
MKQIVLIISILLLIKIAQSQTEPAFQINRYGTANFSGVMKNPAFAGVEEKHTLNMIYSDCKKWDLPEFSVSYSSAFGKKKNLGVGAYYSYSKLGYTSSKESNISISYRMQFNDKTDIRIGLSALTFYRLKYDVEKLLEGAADPEDPLLQSLEENHDYLWYNTGLWFNYTSFYFGFAYLNFWQYDFVKQISKFNPNSVEYSLITGYDFRLKTKWGINPNIQMRKMSGNKTYFFDFSFFVDYSNLVFAGISYDYSDNDYPSDIKIVAGTLIIKRIRIYGAYKFSTDKNMREKMGLSFWETGLRLQY